MKYLPLSLLALASAVTPAIAGLRTQQAANLEARRFMNEKMGRVADLRAVEVAKDAPYYLYNEANGQGFVMLSKSDYLRPVLAYSDRHSLSLDDPNLPDGLRAWLEWVAEATETLEEYPEAALTAAQQATDVTPIAPLLGQIAWNQDAPFNDLCPMLNAYEHCVTGCVATGMAQTIYYHRYPEQGQGSHSYTEWASGRNHSVNFANQTYNYDLMFDKYSRTCTAAQNAEVAKLNYHCGVSVDMSYGEMSGANEYRICKALIDNFNYDPLAQLCYRDHYTYDEWKSLLIHELENQRPIIFCGSSSEGGHCFILDGINANDLYHVNWGWGGYYNGYFDVSILNPEHTGIGASDSEVGFYKFQSAIVQVGPKGQLTGELQYISSLQANKLTCPTSKVAVGNNVTLNIDQIKNYSTYNVSGKVGLLWMQNGERIAYAPSSKNLSIQAADYYIYYTSVSNNVTIPSTLADGEYEVYAYFQPSSGQFKDSLAILHFNATEAGFLHCSIQNQTATFSKDSYSSNLKDNLIASDWSYENTEYETNREQKISCTLTNNTGSTFCGNYSIKLTKPNKNTQYVVANEIATLAHGESCTLTFNYTFGTTGTWSSDLYVIRQNVDDTRIKINNTQQSFNVVKGKELTLLAEPILLQEYYDRNGEGSFGFLVKNTGSNYSGPIQIQILATKTAKPALTIESDVQIAAGVTDTLIVSGTLEGLTAMKKYWVTGLYYHGGIYDKFVCAEGITNFVQVPIYKEGQHSNAIESIVSDGTHHDIESSIFLPKDIYIMDGKKVLIRE